MLLKRKLYATPLEERKAAEKKTDDLKNANIMTKAGTVGLTAAGGLGLTSLGLGASAIGQALPLRKDINNIRFLRKNRKIRDLVKDQLRQQFGDSIEEKVRSKVHIAEKYFPKYDKIDIAVKGINTLNQGSKASRTVLKNAGRYADIAITDFVDKYGNTLGDKEKEALKYIPKSVKRGSKALLRWKNARALGRAAKWTAGIGGLLYLNGRAMQTGAGMPTTSTSLVSKKGSQLNNK